MRAGTRTAKGWRKKGRDRRSAEAVERANSRANRSTREQLALLDARPGKSKKEMARLEVDILDAG